MKIGDEVIVYFQGEDWPAAGALLEHTANFKNVTIGSVRGGKINGMVDKICEMIPNVVFSNGAPSGGA